MDILVGSDHGGFKLKGAVISRLEELGHQVRDVGVFSAESTDYPEQAVQVAAGVAKGEVERGVLVCGSGVGMSITANRFKGVRAVLAASVEHARLGRLHNDANILCLGERLTPEPLALEILDAFLDGEFEGGRHIRRIQKIDSLTGG